MYIVSVGYPHVYVCSKLIPLERVRMYSSGITGTRTLYLLEVTVEYPLCVSKKDIEFGKQGLIQGSIHC